MANDAKKISQLGVVTTLSANDRVVILANPASSANVKTITTSDFANNVAAKLILNTPPTSNTATGIVGQIAFDSNAIYVCTANNKWGKASLTFSW